MIDCANANGREDQECREDDKEELGRATVVDEPHQGLLLLDQSSQHGRMGNRITEVVKCHANVLT